LLLFRRKEQFCAKLCLAKAEAEAEAEKKQA